MSLADVVDTQLGGAAEGDPLARARFIAQVAENRISKLADPSARSQFISGSAGDKEFKAFAENFEQVRALAAALVEGVEETLRVLEGLDPCDAVRARTALTNVLSAGFRLGGQLTVPARLVTLFVQDDEAQAQRMRDAAAKGTSLRRAKLRGAIMQAAVEAKVMPLTASRTYADSIAPEVQALMGEAKGASPATIEREIAAILKDGESLISQP